LDAAVREGTAADCFTIVFSLRDGHYNDIATPEQMVRLVSALVGRLNTGLASGARSVSKQEPPDEEWRKWRQCADYTAQSIDSLCRDGSLRTDLQREQAHGLLSRLAAEPIHSQPAVEALHRLHND